MAKAAQTADQVTEILDRLAKGIDALYRKAVLRSSRVDDQLATMALQRPEEHRFAWVLEDDQRRDLNELRNLGRDIADWLLDSLAVAEGDAPEERHRRLSSRSRAVLETLEEILAFEPFRGSGTPDEDNVRDLLKSRLEELEGTAADLRDCIKRVGALSAAPSSQQTELPAEAPRNESSTPGVADSAPRSMADIMSEIKKISTTAHPILILGERGTGKTHLAREVHELSGRTGEFRHVSCPTVPRDLFESEMFGHVKGAFSGAMQEQVGHVEAASDGTVFLDEIGDMPLDAQAKLLQVLQEGTYFRVGGKTQQNASCRFVLATNRDLGAMIRESTFRADLYDRISTFTFRVPPLRERRDEIPELARLLVEQNQPEKGERRITVAEREKLRDTDFDWPGNVRMLESAIIRAFQRTAKRSVTAEEILEAARESQP